MTKLYGRPGNARIAIGDQQYDIDEDGGADFADEHVAAAREHGFTSFSPLPRLEKGTSTLAGESTFADSIRTSIARSLQLKEIADRLTTLEASVDALRHQLPMLEAAAKSKGMIHAAG